MNRMRLILLLAALVAALLAAYIYSGLTAREVAAPAPANVVVQNNDTVDVLVAAKDLNAGEQLSSFAVEWRPWPRDGVTPQMITRESMPDALEQMLLARARLPMVVGEPIVAPKVVRPGDRGFMSAIVPEGMRAIAIPIGETTAVSGFILPNDRVDVILTRQTLGRDGQRTPQTETVLTNVRVLAINQSLKADDGTTIPGGRNAVLELDPAQAEIISNLNASGTLTLALRSLAESGTRGLSDDRPMLSEAFRNPRRLQSGPLVIRYGLERILPSQ